jgi:hypothetical protein
VNLARIRNVYCRVGIGRIEDAGNGHSWKLGTVPFHLCGVECLYIKLNELLLPRASGKKRPVSLEAAAVNQPVGPAGSGDEVAAYRLIAPSPLRGILRGEPDEEDLWASSGL